MERAIQRESTIKDRLPPSLRAGKLSPLRALRASPPPIAGPADEDVMTFQTGELELVDLGDLVDVTVPAAAAATTAPVLAALSVPDDDSALGGITDQVERVEADELDGLVVAAAPVAAAAPVVAAPIAAALSRPFVTAIPEPVAAQHTERVSKLSSWKTVEVVALSVASFFLGSVALAAVLYGVGYLPPAPSTASAPSAVVIAAPATQSTNTPVETDEAAPIVVPAAHVAAPTITRIDPRTLGPVAARPVRRAAPARKQPKVMTPVAAKPAPAKPVAKSVAVAARPVAARPVAARPVAARSVAVARPVVRPAPIAARVTPSPKLASKPAAKPRSSKNEWLDPFSK